MTLKTLIENLENTANKVERIRKELQKITKDLVELKSAITSMLATAKTNVDARKAEIQREFDK